MDCPSMQHTWSQLVTAQYIVGLGEDSGFWPTRRNIWEQIQWLVQGNTAGDSLFFSFSGGEGSSDPDYFRISLALLGGRIMISRRCLCTFTDVGVDLVNTENI